MNRWRRVHKRSGATCEDLIVQRNRRGTAIIVPCGKKAEWGFKVAGIKKLFYRCGPHKDWIDAIAEAASKTISRAIQGAMK